jgi:puromycin-sensitive aminopeptidase
VFRAGIREYVHRHAFANTETVDLWAALGRAANQPIPAMMDGWIFQPGFPLVTARLDNGQLVLSQQAFTYLPSPPPGASVGPRRAQMARSRARPCRVRRARAGALHPARRAGGPRTGAEPAADAVLVNEGGHGFYRVRYTGALLDRLSGGCPSCTAIERFNLLSDAWAISVAGLMSVPEYVEVTARFRDERDRNVWSIIVASLHASTHHRAGGPSRASRRSSETAWEHVETWGGIPTRRGRAHPQLRGDLLRRSARWATTPARRARRRALRATRRRRDIRRRQRAAHPHRHSGPRGGCHNATTSSWVAFRSAATRRMSKRYLYALTGFMQPELLEQTLQRTINDEIRTQDAPFVVRRLPDVRVCRELAWGS